MSIIKQCTQMIDVSQSRSKDGWLYVDNKRVSYVGPDEDDDDFIDEDGGIG